MTYGPAPMINRSRIAFVFEVFIFVICVVVVFYYVSIVVFIVAAVAVAVVVIVLMKLLKESFVWERYPLVGHGLNGDHRAHFSAYVKNL